jgi:exportin-2 (importin alpha re-exporter)
MANPLQNLSTTLSSSISPDANTRRQAEAALRQGEATPGFLLLVLQLVNTGEADLVVRQTAGVYFKNAVKRLWPDEDEVSWSTCLVVARLIIR